MVICGKKLSSFDHKSDCGISNIRSVVICTENKSRIRPGVITPPPHQCNVPHQNRPEQGEHKKQKTKVAFAWTSSPPPPPTPPPLPTNVPHQNRPEQGEHKKQKTKVAFAWTSSPPRHPPPSPRTELKDKMPAKESHHPEGCFVVVVVASCMAESSSSSSSSSSRRPPPYHL